MSPNPSYTTTGSEQPAGCQPVPQPRDGMGAVLALLLTQPLAARLDLNACAFLSGGFAAGASLTCPASSSAPYDNLSGTPAASLTGLSPDGCSAEISGCLYNAVPGQSSAVGFTAGAARLTGLDSAAVAAAGSTDAEKAANYQAALQLLQRQLLPPAPGYRCSGAPVPPPPAPPSAAVSLTACRLLLGNVTFVGSAEGVRVYANAAACRFYLVRSDCTGFCGA